MKFLDHVTVENVRVYGKNLVEFELVFNGNAIPYRIDLFEKSKKHVVSHEDFACHFCLLDAVIMNEKLLDFPCFCLPLQIYSELLLDKIKETDMRLMFKLADIS